MRVRGNFIEINLTHDDKGFLLLLGLDNIVGFHASEDEIMTIAEFREKYSEIYEHVSEILENTFDVNPDELPDDTFVCVQIIREADLISVILPVDILPDC